MLCSTPVLCFCIILITELFTSLQLHYELPDINHSGSVRVSSTTKSAGR